MVCWWVTGQTAMEMELLRHPGAEAVPSWKNITNVEEYLSNMDRAWPLLESPTHVRVTADWTRRKCFVIVDVMHLYSSSLSCSVEVFRHSCSSRHKLLFCSWHWCLFDIWHLFGWEIPADRSHEPWFNLVSVITICNQEFPWMCIQGFYFILLLFHVGTTTCGMRPGWLELICHLVSEVGRWLIPLLNWPARASPAAAPLLLLRSAAVRSSWSMMCPSFSLKCVNSFNLPLCHTAIIMTYYSWFLFSSLCSSWTMIKFTGRGNVMVHLVLSMLRRM